jgi:hypothetical protein
MPSVNNRGFLVTTLTLKDTISQVLVLPSKVH